MNRLKEEKGSSYIEFLIIFPFVLLLTFVGLFSLLNMQLRNQMSDNLSETMRETITADTYFIDGGLSNAVDELMEGLSLYHSTDNPDGWFVEYIRIYSYNIQTGLEENPSEMYAVKPARKDEDIDYESANNWVPKTEEAASEMNRMWRIGNELEIRIWRPTDKKVGNIVNSIFTINFFEKQFTVVENNVIVTGRMTIENERY